MCPQNDVVRCTVVGVMFTRTACGVATVVGVLRLLLLLLLWDGVDRMRVSIVARIGLCLCHDGWTIARVNSMLQQLSNSGALYLLSPAWGWMVGMNFGSRLGVSANSATK
ncbi:hypothetical protein F5Y14DRAFT_415863 [Nemania sp. NC0429]|nr:hypothetical protein F5Y14DRAFT_415863 [Nemania sp. NC0429]